MPDQTVVSEVARKNHSDPLWDTRRKRLDMSLFATFGLMLLSIIIGPDMAIVVVPPGFLAAGGILGWYFSVASKERIALGTTVTEEVKHGPEPGAVETTKTTVEKKEPADPPAEEAKG